MMENKIRVGEVFLIVLLGIAVYFNSFWVNFIWDDSALVLNNPLIKGFSHTLKIFFTHLSYANKFYRPIQNLTYIVDFSLYKFNYQGYHLTNILLHILVTLLFFKLTLILTENKKLSFSASLLYLVCPLWVESVTYISGRADILLALFILLSFIFYLKERLVVSLIFYIFAILSKEAGLIYPLILVIHTALFKKFNRKAALSLCAFFTILIIYIVLRSTAAAHVGVLNIVSKDYPFSAGMLFFIKAIAKYLGLLFFPLNQCMSYTVKLPASFWEKDVLISSILVILLFYIFFSFLKKDRVISFFIAWFFCMLIPYSGAYPINAFFADHFIYLSAMGVFVIFAYFLLKVKQKKLVNLVFFGYLAFFSLATIKYNFIWQDEVKFYKRIIRVSANSFAAYNNLGAIYLKQGNPDAAKNLFEKAIGISPEFIEARLNLARFYYLNKDYARAIELARGVLEKKPLNPMALNFLGVFYLRNNDYKLAAYNIKKAVELSPGHVSFLLDLYSFYSIQGNSVGAREVRERIARLDKYSLAKIYSEDARQLLEKNELDRALLSVEEALKINPYLSDYYNLKGVILRKKGNYPESLRNFKQALRISSSNWEVYNNTGNLFAIIGDFDNAKRYFHKAIALNKNFADAYFNLGLLYFQRQDFTLAEGLFYKALSLSSSHALAKEYLEKIKNSQKRFLKKSL